MKLLKLLMTGIGIILLVVVIAVLIFIVTFDANQYKQNLSQLVEQQTGRKLEFQGDIGLTLYPALGMKLGSLSFSNATGFDPQPMLAVDKASVSVDLLSLLWFSPKIDQLVLDGLNLNLQKNKQGLTNWDDLVAADSGPADDSAAQTEVKEDGSGAGLSSLAGSFGGLNITRAKLLWKDDSQGVEYQVTDLSLISGRIEQGLEFPLEMNMVLQSQKQLLSTISLSSRVVLDKEKISLSSLKLKTSASGEMIPVEQVEIDLSGDVSYVLSSNQLAIKGFTSKIKSRGGVLAEADVAMAGEIGFDLNQQQLTVGALDLQATLTDTAMPNGMIKTGVSASQLIVLLGKNALELKDLQLTLNKDVFKGFIKVHDYTQPSLDFSLSTSRLNIDELMGLSTGPQPEPVSETQQPEDVEIALPLELLRSLKLNGKLEVGTLIAQELTLSNILLQVTSNNGVLDLKPFKMDLYGGQFDASIQLNAQGKQPRYLVRKKLTSFQVGQFLKDFTGDDMISGMANIEADLESQGEWLSQLKSGLNGNLKIAINDGALKGFNLRHELEAAKAKLKGKSVPENRVEQTDFSAMSISGIIKQGVFSSDDLNIQAPLVRVGGKGSADLAKETVDYLVNAKLVGTTTGQQGGEADEFTGLAIPVAITGPWISPNIDVQLDEMLKAKLNAEKARIGDEVAKEKAELQKKLAVEKEKLKAAQAKKLEAEKAQLEKQKQLAEAEKQKKQAEMDAKVEAEKEKAKKKLDDKLKKLF